MKILITGGAGFVGTNLIISLKQKGHTLVSIDNYSIGQRNNHIEGVAYLDMDANEIGSIQNDFDLIYHLAGLSRIQPSFENPFEILRKYPSKFQPWVVSIKYNKNIQPTDWYSSPLLRKKG